MALMDLVNGYDWEGSADNLEEMMREFYPEIMKLAYGASADALPVDVSFDLTNPKVKETIDALCKNIRGVADTTKDDIKALVGKSTSEGWSIPDLAKAIREKGDISSRSRSETVARTESAVAYSRGSILAYGDAGVKKVQVLDGDEDAECAAANGATWTLEEAAANPIAHPRCTRAFIPIVE